MAIFKGCQITLELDSSLPFKKKTQLKQKIIDNGGIISFIVTKKSTHLVVNNAEKAQDSYKSRMAQKWGVPVVSVSFIDACLEARKLLESDKYVVAGRTASEEFSTGKIIASMPDKMKSDHRRKKRQRSNINLNQLKVHPWPRPSDSDVPDFPENSYDVVRHAFLKKFDSRTRLTSFVSMEIHVVSSEEDPLYRVFVHKGIMEKKDKNGELGVSECRYVATPIDVEAVYTYLYRQFTSSPHHMERVQFLSPHVGSPGLRKILAEVSYGGGAKGEKLHPLVFDLVGYVWAEAIGELESVLSVPVQSIKMEQIEKAEAALMTIKRILDSEDGDKAQEIAKHSKEFNSSLPNSTGAIINSKRMIADRQQLCQLIRDVVSVSETTNWSQRSGTAAKYHALRCNISPLDHTSEEYNDIQDHVLSSQDSSVSGDGDDSVEILNIYTVHRAVEDSNFTHSIDNKQLLFHSSAVQNFVGILSRGLLLPKIVVDDFGGTRSDPGMLGCGIYFADSATLSAKYSKPGKTSCKNRLMLVNQVALGKVKDFTNYQKNLTSPPDGYNSVRGIKSSDEEPSDFKASEYVVYGTSQQRIRYLVEFKMASDMEKEKDDEKVHEVSEELDSDSDEKEEETNDVSISDVKDITNPLSKVEAGLKADGGDVPLQAVHIRAQLIDLAAKVIVLQSYKNNSTVPIEAKYVFPLDDMAAVCGFEAFINGKHIVGEVKEKEQAHKEYKQAISEGHGAYLMDEETPDVFTVSVGNLPPGASVLIKITYVAELQVEGEKIVFSLPGTVAPWKQDAALEETTQTDVDKVKVRSEAKKLSVQISVEMPFDINSIESPTHKIKMKKTATKATVEMCSGEKMGSDFQLLVGLSEIHVPRMWVEEDEKGHHACMLTFYPEFEAESISENEILLMLDLSNSMKGEPLENAKKIVLLLLHHLPPQTYFNIITFGAMFDTLFPSSVPVNKESLSIAQKFIQKCQANMGSTDIWRPLHSLQLLSCGSVNERNTNTDTLPPKSVFIVSDGHMTEEAPTISAIKDGLKSSRVFTFGVSSTANRHFLRSMARVGGGCEEFFETQKKSHWERKIKDQLSKAFQPALTGVNVEWWQHDNNAPTPVQAPKEIVSVFSGSRLVVYGFVPFCNQTTLKAFIGRKEISTMVSTSDLAMTNGKTLHQLTARAIIRDWTEGSLDSNRTEHEIIKRDTKSFIINTSKEYSVVSQFTSFVAIEKREKDEKFDKDNGPSIEELVAKEVVDKLDYMGWEVDQGADPVQDAIDRISDTIAEMAGVTDPVKLEKKYREVWDSSDKILKPYHPEKIKLLERFVLSYVRQKRFTEAKDFLDEAADRIISTGADEFAISRVKCMRTMIALSETRHMKEKERTVMWRESKRERNELTKLTESKEKTKASYSFSATAGKVPKYSLQRYESDRKVEEETESDDTGVASFKLHKAKPWMPHMEMLTLAAAMGESEEFEEEPEPIVQSLESLNLKVAKIEEKNAQLLDKPSYRGDMDIAKNEPDQRLAQTMFLNPMAENWDDNMVSDTPDSEIDQFSRTVKDGKKTVPKPETKKKIPTSRDSFQAVSHGYFPARPVIKPDWTHSVGDFSRSMPGLPMSQYSSGIQPDNAQVSSSFSPGSPPSFSPIARRRPIAVSSCFLESSEIPSLVQLQNVTTTSTSDALNRHSELSLRSSSPPRSLIRLSKTGRATFPRPPPLPSGSHRLFTGTQNDFHLPKPPPIPPKSLRGQLTQDRSPVPMQPFIPSDGLYGKQFAATQDRGPLPKPPPNVPPRPPRKRLSPAADRGPLPDPPPNIPPRPPRKRLSPGRAKMKDIDDEISQLPSPQARGFSSAVIEGQESQKLKVEGKRMEESLYFQKKGKKAHGSGGITIDQLQEQVDQTKRMMASNLEKVLERGEKLEDLEIKADELNEEAYFYELDGEDEDMYCQSVPQDSESEIYYDLFDGIEEEGRSECVLAASLDSSTAADDVELLKEKEEVKTQKVNSFPVLDKAKISLIFSSQQTDGKWNLEQLNSIVKPGISNVISDILQLAGAKSLGLKAYKELCSLIATLLVLRLLVVNFPTQYEIMFSGRISVAKCPQSYKSMVSKAVDVCQRITNHSPGMIYSLELGYSLVDAIDRILYQCA